MKQRTIQSRGKQQQRPSTSRPPEQPRPQTAKPPPTRFAAPIVAPTLATVLGRMIMIVFGALGAGGMVAAIVGVILSFFSETLFSFGGNATGIVFTSFMLVFLVIAVPLLIKLFRWYDYHLSLMAAQEINVAAVRAAQQKKKRPWLGYTPKKVGPFESRFAPEFQETRPEAEAPAQNFDPPPKRDPIAEVVQAQIEPIPALASASSPGVSSKKKAAKPTSEQAADKPLKRNESVKEFRSALLAEIGEIRDNIDSYARFGVDLLLAGAVECYASANHLQDDAKKLLLEDSVKLAGSEEEAAQNFADRFRNYLHEPRYKAMVNTGRQSMQDYMSGNKKGLKEAVAAFRRWNAPRDEAAAGKPMIFSLFVDLFGVEALLSNSGEQAAHIMRECGSIIRDVFKRHSGQENSGVEKGMKAAFQNAADGVTTAIAIQRSMAQFIARQPDSPIRVRIGLDAYEKKDDPSDSNNKGAENVCQYAQPGQILCTDIVRELAGKGFEFSQVGGGAWDVKW